MSVLRLLNKQAQSWKNSYKLVDPLSLADKLQSLKEEREDLYKELDTAVKISNATTMIQVNF